MAAVAYSEPAEAGMENPVRIGAVNYLNTKPLICDLEELAPDIELLLDVPSRLADLLAEGRLDVALIPVIEYFRAGSYSIVPNIAIASRGPVLSVTLFSRVPWANIRRVALDAGSRSSAALAQILLRRRYGVQPELTPFCSSATGPCAPVCPDSLMPSISGRNGTTGRACRSFTRFGRCARES